MAYTARPYPDWSWSQSREAVFAECARKYYYHYYASHNGWLPEADELAKTAYRLKQLTNLYLLLGDAVHQAAEQALRRWTEDRALPDPEALVRSLRGRLNQAFLDSRDRAADWRRAPKKRVMLHEMYYGGRLPERRVQQIRERLRVCAERLPDTDTWRELAAGADLQMREIEVLNTFKLDGEKIYVKLDCLYERPDGTWVIVDWKTGQEDERNERQQLLYAWFLHDHYAVPFEDIDIRLEYLLAGASKVLEFDEDGLEAVREEVAASVAGMKAMLADEAENRPLPMEAFEPKPSGQACAFCSYAEICDAKV